MRLQLGEPPKDADPFQYFIQSLKLSGAGQGTIKLYYSAINDFLKFVNKNPNEVTTQDVINWINVLSVREGRSKTGDRKGRASTIRSYVIAVRRFLRWLGVNVRPPVPRIRTPERRALRESEIENIISSCKRLRDRALISLLLDTGLRSSELLSITVGDLDLQERTIRVRETKNGEERIVFFTARTASLLNQFIRKTKKGENERVFEITYQALYKLVKRLGKKNGISWLRPHILRHTFATNAIKKGAPLPVVQRLLGHKDIKTTQIYTHLMTDDLKRVYRDVFEG